MSSQSILIFPLPLSDLDASLIEKLCKGLQAQPHVEIAPDKEAAEAAEDADDEAFALHAWNAHQAEMKAGRAVSMTKEQWQRIRGGKITTDDPVEIMTRAEPDPPEGRGPQSVSTAQADAPSSPANPSARRRDLPGIGQLFSVFPASSGALAVLDRRSEYLRRKRQLAPVSLAYHDLFMDSFISWLADVVSRMGATTMDSLAKAVRELTEAE